ncbi:MAG: hypothetical protein HQ581_03125 [Planctomycetes bacterium]|nr:hypothetical protein [Planctomycetota bacterium]
MNDRQPVHRCFLAAFLLLAATDTPAHAAVRDAWVTTDRTVDCSSFESIASDIIKPDMSDEEKAIAVYTFFRQRVYHYRNLPESREPLKTVNIMGNTLCGSQGTCMKGLLASVGLKARVVSHPGHTFYEVFYDGQWHGYDTMTNFYVFTRGPQRTVASFEQLHNDPTLIRGAEKEGRACPNICPCGDKPEWFAQKTRATDYTPQTSDWTVKDYQLRLGEELVRSWWPQGKPLPGSYRSSDPGPLHTCGTRDRRAEPFLFKFWEPYGIPKFGPSTTVSYRHYFNGQINYSPDLTHEESVLDGGGKLDEAKMTSSGLVGPGTYSFSVVCPFYITGGVLLFEADCAKEDAVEVHVDQHGGGWQKLFAGGRPGEKQYRVPLDRIVARSGVGRHEYNVRIVLGEDSVLKNMYLRTWFQHNAMAAPHLMSGENNVTVDVANEDALKAAPLTLVYRYRDAPNWDGPVKTVEQRIARSAETFSVPLPKADKLPRMRDLTLRYGQLAWTPPKQVRPDRIIADFTQQKDFSDWQADAPLQVSHDGQGLLVVCPRKETYPQVSLDGLNEDWSDYDAVVIELENVGPKTQAIVFRARSNDTNDQRTDVTFKVQPGPAELRIPIKSLRKTQADSITKIYLMTLDVPEEGCKIRVKRIVLQPDRSGL